MGMSYAAIVFAGQWTAPLWRSKLGVAVALALGAWHTNCTTPSRQSAFMADGFSWNPLTSFSSSGWAFGVAPSLLSFCGLPPASTARVTASTRIGKIEEGSTLKKLFENMVNDVIRWAESSWNSLTWNDWSRGRPGSPPPFPRSYLI